MEYQKCLCGDKDDAEADSDWMWDKTNGHPSRASYWSPNPSAVRNVTQHPSFLGISFKKRWKELEGDKFVQSSKYSSNQGHHSHYSPSPPFQGPNVPVPPEHYSCFLEATAASSLNQFDASSYSSGTVSSGVGSLPENSLQRSRSSSSSRRKSSPGNTKKTPGILISRKRSPSSLRRKANGEYSRCRSADSSFFVTNSLSLPISIGQSSSLPKNLSPSQRLSRKKKRDREIQRKRAEKNRSNSLPHVIDHIESSDDDLNKHSAKRSRSSSRSKVASHPVVAKANSLGGVAREPDSTQCKTPSRHRSLQKSPNLLSGDLVWFDPGLGYVLPGEVIEFHRAGQVITVQAVIGGKTQTFTLTNLSSVKRRQDLGMDGVNDMITLSDLNEASLLWNLKIRYDKEQIYTYTGSILVSVNPYKMSDIYGLDAVKRYEGQILGTLPPHIFAIGSACYSRLSKDQKAQCVIISGESGAGKTEATKLIMQYLAAVNKSASNLVTEQILEASPLLESFGNAKTIKNDNSSRFGKYLEVFFRSGVITGARVTEYLLEKSRIVTQATGERNYHVFYEMLSGLTEESKAKYGLTTADKYFYLNQGGATVLPAKEDGEDFNALLSAIQVLGFSTQEQDVMFRILATVLHLGNVYFHRKQMKHGQEAVEIGSNKEIKWAAHLLQIDSEGIIRALTTKSTEARNERMLTTLNIDQALDARDAVAKALYSALFNWLVRRINQIICNNKPSSMNISILDIFGFESFKENSFEQLCINYANEKLQFYFNKQIFKLEQQEYAKEKIEWQNIDFKDNLTIIELLSRKPVGILHLLDDESNFPKATDVSFLEKCHYNHALNELYSRPRMSSMEFGIQHFAGQVWYSVDGFLDKNRDTLRNDVIELLISSKIKLVSDMFMDLRIGSYEKTLNKANGRFITMKPRTPTVAARFHDSLTSLTDSMTKCNPWFIRCIKPNNEKAPLKLDMPCVLEQLRYSGMLETIKIRQQGYPVRLAYGQFAERYRCLVPGQVPRGAPSQEICKVVLQKAVYSPGAFQLGSNKVFLKEALEKILEQERYKKLSASVVVVQKYVRGFIARRKFQNSRSAAVKIQSAVRMHQNRTRYVKLRKGVVKAQALAKGRYTRRRYRKMKEDMARRKKAAAAAAAARAASAAANESAADEALRQQRAVTAVNHLEVPAELAFVFSKTKDSQGLHTERNVTKAITAAGGSVHSQQIPYHLPQGLDFYPFTKFTNVYFKSHLWGMKREPIRTPFLPKSRDSDYADSLAIFKLILRFMNDTSLSKQKETVLADYIVNKGLTNENLRDEILCQLCNQTWRNDNTGNAERGWLLMANCLSSFQPTDVLYNYLLKYVTDNAPNGFANLCQHKILSGNARSEGVARTFPPTFLEWRANSRKSKMALEGHCPDGKSTVVEVDSWTTGSEFAAQVLHSRGIETNSSGWSVALAEHDNLYELPGEEYVLDLIASKEMPSSFPSRESTALYSGPAMEFSKYSMANGHRSDDLHESPVVARRSRSPPPLSRKLSREALEVHDKAMTSTPLDESQEERANGLSRTSALNSRYFDDKSKSRSLDNLIEPTPAETTMQDLGLSSSKLNDRYHSVERLTEESNESAPVPLPANGRTKVISKAKDKRIPAPAKAWSKGEESRTPSVASSRYIKAPQGMGRRLGGQNTRAYIEREYMKSSAMSDTSEAPSLASHVRRVRVPSQASDVDQYLDELFIPVLEHQIDDMSDARSLAASIKGGSDLRQSELDEGLFLGSRQSFRRESVLQSSFSEKHSSLMDLYSAEAICRSLKGGGGGVADIESQGASSSGTANGYYQRTSTTTNSGPASPPLMPMNTMPLYSPGGMMVPGMNPQAAGMAAIDPTNLMAYQQNLQRAYIQSAVAQNIQIQQHLMAQNQALQQLLTPNIPQSSNAGLSMLGGLIPQPQAVGMAMQASIPGTPLVVNPSNINPSTTMNTSTGNVSRSHQEMLNRSMNQETSSKSSRSVMMSEASMMSERVMMSETRSHRKKMSSSSTDSNGFTSVGKVSFQEPEHGDVWNNSDKSAVANSNITATFSPVNINNSTANGGSNTVSPPPPLLPVGSALPAGLSFSRAAAASSPLHHESDHHQIMAHKYQHQMSSRSHESSGGLHQRVPYDQHYSPGSPPSSGGGNNSEPPYPSGHIPAAPPLPTHLNQGDLSPGFMDPYQRAKTVRIGKWRWPPAKEDVDQSFMHFKRSKSNRKSSDGKNEFSRSYSQDESDMIEWDEFDMSHNDHNSRKERVVETSSKNKNFMAGFDDMDGSGEGVMPPYRISRSSIISRSKSKQNGGKEMDIKDGGGRRRRDSWDNPIEETPRSNHKEEVDEWDTPMDDDKNESGIGKIKISREMKEKLMALTSSPTTRTQNSNKSENDNVKRGGVKKLENHRRLMLQQQLAGDKWSSVDSVNRLASTAPPPPVAPPSMNAFGRGRSGSPALSASSIGSSAAIPQPRSPPPSIQPVGGLRNSEVDGRRVYRNGERNMDRASHFELEESHEFLPSVDRGAPLPVGRKSDVKGTPTRLLVPPPGQHIIYTKVPWKLMIRKEVFFPGEQISGDALQLVMCQVVVDAYSGNTCRIQSEQRSTMRKLLETHGITPNNCLSGHHSLSVRNEVVNLAKSWPLYFAALYPVAGNKRGGDGEMVAVSHSGLRMVKRDGKDLLVTSTYRLEDIEEVEAPRPGVLHVVVYGGSGSVSGGSSQRLVLYTARAPTLAAMIGQFASAAQPQGSRSYVRAVADYKTRESRLLSFNKGDIIRVTSSEHYQGKGWLEGSVDGKTGLFPMECVVPIGRAEARMGTKAIELESRESDIRMTSNGLSRAERINGHGSGGSTSSWGAEKERPYLAPPANNANQLMHQDDSGHSSGGEGGMGSGGERILASESNVTTLNKSNTLQNRDMAFHSDEILSASQYSTQFANDGKHSLLQFALKYFRMSKEQNLVAPDGTLTTNKDKSKKKKNNKDSSASWTWKDQVEMVKFTQSPLRASLLQLEQEVADAAVDVIFLSVMRYMGDYPMEQGQRETDCVYNILSNCHKHETLRDELYCQIMKQTTSNKSSIPDSCQRGWRLFSIIAAYFNCSDILKPYLFKYLETNAYDKRRAFHGTAMVSLQNLRKTFKYGGRKNVPTVDEITALTAGRNSKREMYRLPGGTERVINTRSTSVVQDILEELCLEIGVTSPEEQEEFSMYCLVEGESFTMPLAREEYILDVTTELRKNNQAFYLIFCRSVWYCPLRLDTPLYVEVVFNQIAPDYLEGLLLVAPGEKLPQHLILDIAKIAALMHRAADLDLEPTMSEVKFLLPKQALVLQMVEPAQWVNMVQGAWPDVSKLTTMQAKSQVLEILEQWELFGSSFFTVKRMLEGQQPMETILALNKRGVHFLDYHTHETLEHYDLSQVFSTRKVKSEDGYLYLDMKFGNLQHHRISRIQTIQAPEISRLFRQYITIEQRVTGGQNGDVPRDVTLSR